jgi:medium-chain acyl-CoA ligase, mitochondrial
MISSSIISIKFEKLSIFLVFVDLVATQRKKNLNLPEMEYAIIGGSVCTPALMQEARNVLGIKKFRSIYGLTEATSTVFHSLPDEDSQIVENFVGCVGDHIEAKVVDKDGKTVPFGQPGELCVRGYCTMLGYYNDDKKTEETLDSDSRW